MTNQEKIVLARMVEMQQRIEGFTDITLQELEKVYKAESTALLREVKKARGKSARIWTNTRLIALLEETQLMHATILDKLTSNSADSFAELGSFAYKEMNNIVSWDNRILGFNNVALSKDKLRNLVKDQPLAGKLLREWIGDALEPNIDAIKAGIVSGQIRGEGFAKTVSRLANELDLSGKNKRDLESIVKTYTQATNVAAQQDVYEANTNIVKKVEWNALLEAADVKTGRGTCQRCMALDGQQWETNNYERPPCPLHVRCRCMLLPVTPTWRELGLDMDEMEKIYRPWRDRLDGKDDIGRTDKTYAQWFMSKDKAFQDRAMGPVRAQMLRDGEIEFNQLVDTKGNLILIKNLETKTFTRRAPTLYGHEYATLSASSIFDTKDKGTLGKILSIWDECDE